MAAESGNQYAIGNNGGRPAIYNTPEELLSMCNQYFLWILGERAIKKEDDTEIIEWERIPENATITGLALFLGFCDRQSLNDYEKKEEFSFIIRRAKARVEMEYEKALRSDKSPTGSIFVLKNMGWKDKTEQELTGRDGSDLFHNKTDDELKLLLKEALSKVSE